MPKVIIIDDNRFEVRPYRMALEAAGYDVVHIPNIKDVRKILVGTEHSDASFLIVDMMMDPEPLFTKIQTSDGVYTGLFTSRDLRKKFPVIPIILWTNALEKEIRAHAEAHAAIVSNCLYAYKVDVSPVLLERELTFYLRKGRFRRKPFKFLWKAAEIGVKMLGLGADIKEIKS